MWVRYDYDDDDDDDGNSGGSDDNSPKGKRSSV